MRPPPARNGPAEQMVGRTRERRTDEEDADEEDADVKKTAPKSGPEYEGRTYERRWWTLGVLCISLVMIVVANASLNVALPTLVDDLHAGRQLTAVDRRRVQPGVRRDCSSPRGRSATATDGDSRSMVVSSSSAWHRASPRSRTRPVSSSRHARSWASAPRSSCRPRSPCWRTCSRPRNARRPIAIWAGFAGVGAALGGVVSGWLLEHFWWGSIFLTNVVVVAVALVAGAFLIPKANEDHEPALDLVGALLSIAGLGALVYAIIEAPNRGWLSGLRSPRSRSHW